MNDLTQEIGLTSSRRYTHRIQSDYTAYARLKKLNRLLCPSTAERELQLTAKYRQLQSRPQSSNIDSWLEEWLNVVRMCEAVYLPDVASPRAQGDFLLAIEGLDDAWAIIQQATSFRAQLNAQLILTLDDLVAEFIMYWRSTMPDSVIARYIRDTRHRSEFRQTIGQRSSAESQSGTKDRRL